MVSLLMAAALLGAQTGPAVQPDVAGEIQACRVSDLPWGEERADREANCLAAALYGPGRLERIDVLGEHAPLLFSAAALADINAAIARADGEAAPGLDVDPLCGCQDPGGLNYLAGATVVNSDGTGAVAVTFTFEPISEAMTPEEVLARLTPENRHTVRLDLVLEDGGWRIDDVQDGEGGPSFRETLQR